MMSYMIGWTLRNNGQQVRVVKDRDVNILTRDENVPRRWEEFISDEVR